MKKLNMLVVGMLFLAQGGHACQELGGFARGGQRGGRGFMFMVKKEHMLRGMQIKFAKLMLEINHALDDRELIRFHTRMPKPEGRPDASALFSMKRKFNFMECKRLLIELKQLQVALKDKPRLFRGLLCRVNVAKSFLKQACCGRANCCMENGCGCSDDSARGFGRKGRGWGKGREHRPASGMSPMPPVHALGMMPPADAPGMTPPFPSMAPRMATIVIGRPN